MSLKFPDVISSVEKANVEPIQSEVRGERKKEKGYWGDWEFY